MHLILNLRGNTMNKCTLGNSVLTVDDLHIQYQTDDATVYAVNGINLNLQRGTTLGLVGETGAGKTTSVLALLGLVPKPQGKITGGEIIVKGHRILDLSSKELSAIRGKEIAMIFQDPMTSLNPVMSVGTQIQEAFLLHERMSKHEAEKKAREMLRMVGIPEDRFSDYPHQFSGGMKQRVVIAIALACEPDILIADEPTTALDVTIQAQVLELINNLKHKMGTAVIMITHDLGIVAETCDEVAVMYAGKIVEYGTLRDVFKNTKHPYTEGLFNSLPKMNDRQTKLTPIKGMIPDPTIEYKTCAFIDRCPYASERCRSESPSEIHINDLHTVLCSRYQEPGFHINGGR